MLIVKNNNTYYSSHIPDAQTYFWCAEKIKTELNNFICG